MSKKPAPMYGQKEDGRSVEDKVRIIRDTLRDHERAIQHAQTIGRRYLDGVTLSEAGKSYARTLDAYMDSRGMDRASLSARVTAMQELAPLRFSEDCSPGDLKLVLHQGVAEQTAAPSSQFRRQVDALTFSDGTPVSAADREEVSRLGGVARYERLRGIAQAKGLDLNVRASREIAEAVLFGEVSSTVACAKSLDEAVFVLQRQDKSLSLRDATIKAVEMNPALRGSVGGGRQSEGNGNVVAFSQDEDVRQEVDRLTFAECRRHGWSFDDEVERAKAQQLVHQKRPDLARRLYFQESEQHMSVRVDDTQAVAFTAKVEELLSEQSLPRTPENVAKASNAVRKRYPHLVMLPGSRGKG